MTDRFNTIAGWVLFAGIVALGGTVLSKELFHSERPETMGYPIEGVSLEGEDGAKAEEPIAVYLAKADAAKGETVFKKCAACHNADPGGANALGPALHGVMGNPVAAHPGFAFSDALKGKGGTWDWETMSAWLANPKKFAPGTKMTFAGLSNPQERADLMAFLNTRDSSPLPLPAAPAAGADPEAQANQNVAGSGTNDGAQKAENEPPADLKKESSLGAGSGGEAAPGAGPSDSDGN